MICQSKLITVLLFLFGIINFCFGQEKEHYNKSRIKVIRTDRSKARGVVRHITDSTIVIFSNDIHAIKSDSVSSSGSHWYLKRDSVVITLYSYEIKKVKYRTKQRMVLASLIGALASGGSYYYALSQTESIAEDLFGYFLVVPAAFQGAFVGMVFGSIPITFNVNGDKQRFKEMKYLLLERKRRTS